MGNEDAARWFAYNSPVPTASEILKERNDSTQKTNFEKISADEKGDVNEKKIVNSARVLQEDGGSGNDKSLLNIPGENGKEVVIEKSILITGEHVSKWKTTWNNYGRENSRLAIESDPIFSRIADSLLSNPDLQIEIGGYTDNIGAETHNRNLSRKRADVVKDFLVSKGIASDHLVVVGYGESNPIAANRTFEGRAANNRIEFRVIPEQNLTQERNTSQNNSLVTTPKNDNDHELIAKKETESTNAISKEPEQPRMNIGQEVGNICNSSDVKLRAPLRKNWSYKARGIILNQQTFDTVCYLNTESGISAISLNTGEELWNYHYPESPIISSVTTFAGNYAAFLSYEYLPNEEKGKSKLYIIDLLSGKEKWNISFEDVWFKPSILLNEKYVFAIGGKPDEWKELGKYYEMEHDEAYLYCYSIRDGKEIWESELDDSKTELLTLSPDKIFLIFDYEITKEIPLNKLLCIDLRNGEKTWEYDPSGLFIKSSVGDVIYNDDKLFTRPLKGYPGIIAAIDPANGEEIWSKNNGADNLFFHKNKVFAFSANAEWEFGSTTSWLSIDAASGDKIFYKELDQSTKFTKILAAAIAGIGVVAVVLTTVSNVVGLGNLITSLFGASDEYPIPKIIPTSSLFNGLLNSSVLNDKGLFGIYRKGNSYVLNITDDNPDDEKKNEYEFKDGANDVSIANGTSPTNIFSTYGGKIVLINIKTGREEWSKDISPGATSLGLITVGNKLYLFTTQELIQLVNE